MPIYEFECPAGHITEKIFFETIDFTFTIDCPRCWDWGKELKTAHRIWSLPAKMDLGKPTIVFKNNKTGETRIATHSYEKPPRGFVQEELRTPMDRTRFEKEDELKAKVVDEQITQHNKLANEESRKRRQDKLAADLSKVAAVADNPSAAKSLLKKAMARNRKKDIPKRKTSFKFEVNK